MTFSLFKTNIAIALMLLFGTQLISQENNKKTEPEYYKDRVLFKVKSDYRSITSNTEIKHSDFNQIINQLQGATVSKWFPNHTPPATTGIHGNATNLVDITLIYELRYNDNIDPVVIVEKLQKLNLFEYVEVQFIMQTLAAYTPNDPNIPNQWHLDIVNAFEAWGIEKGDTNVVVGITDTGFELSHPDLADAVKYNYNDTIDGVDNDNDGFIDNFYGWDVADNDNNPDYETNNHGIAVVGVSNATTDNNNQIAGTGFKTKFLPVKILSAGNSLASAYQGIIYAADHGCTIINASWGAANAYNQTANDIINYATFNKGALVVCAAGNDNKEDLFYPASYENAMSVGGTRQSDQKWTSSSNFGSNFNYRVDIMAPGHDVFSILNGGNTASGRVGTSIASPIVAGAAAIIKSQNPTWLPFQIKAQLMATADVIDTMSINSAFVNKLGHGRLNMERAVTDFSFPGFHMTNLGITDNNDNWFVANDTIEIWGEIYNFLATSSPSAKATITTSSPYIELIEDEKSIAGITTLNAINLISNPFKVKVLPGSPVNQVVTFVIFMTDVNGYKAKYSFDIVLNTDYFNYNYNNIGTTITSVGKIGYNANNQSQGVGVQHNDEASVLFQMGFIMGNADNSVSLALSDEFTSTQSLNLTSPGIESKADAVSYFDDSSSPNPLGISIKQKTLSWDETKRGDFIIVEYTLTNNSADTVNNLHAGIYADWDIISYQQNEADFDSVNQLAYVYHSSGKHAGIHLINDTNINHYAFENTGTNGSFNLGDGFTKTEQFQSISNGNARKNSLAPTDISHVLASGPYNILPGDSVVVAYSILVQDNLTSLTNAALESDTAYDEIRNVELAIQTQNNIKCNANCDGEIEVSINKGISPYSILWSDPLNQTTALASSLCPGTYSCYIEDAIGNKDTVEVTLTEPIALSGSFTDTLPDLGSCEGAVTIIASGGIQPYTYIWNASTSDSSRATNLCVGDNYVTVTDSNGCELNDTIQISILTSTNDIDGENILMYPNPANTIVNIELDNFNWNSIEVRNVIGNLVYTDEINSSIVKLRVDSWAAGIYFITIKGNGNQFTKVLHVNK